MAGHEADAYPEIGTVIFGTDPNGPSGPRRACSSKHVPDSGPILWADPAPVLTGSAHRIGPCPDCYQEGSRDPGPIGPIGPISSPYQTWPNDPGSPSDLVDRAARDSPGSSREPS